MFNFKKPTDAIGAWENFRSKIRLYPTVHAPHTTLHEVQNFGSNPGNLRMFTHMPRHMAGQPGLVVVLHGCAQTAAGYDEGAGWSTLADRYGFALLMPEQQRSNNPHNCFNWFQPEDSQRGRGEAASIRQMIELMAREKNIDARRVFVTGLSAGGAMTSVMLACYPAVFAGGAIIAGLPYGAASNVQQAFESMFQCPSRTARDWGDRVRAASSGHQGSWPRVSVWHGQADKTVIPLNAREILKQWTDVHGLPTEPSIEGTVDGYPRQVWLNKDGEELVESYTITHMAHGTPLATGNSDSACGVPGPFLLEVGISSSFHIAKFFGLTAAGVRSVSRPETRSMAPSAVPEQTQPQGFHNEGPEKFSHAGRAGESRINIGAVITKALEAAGLIRP